MVLLLLLGAAVGGARSGLAIRPQAEALAGRRERLDAERRRLAETRAQLLRLGSEGIASRNRVLRAEVERREALAPAGTAEAAALAVRERFAALAARYGVHAPVFEQLAPQTVGELEVGAMRIRAAGNYHALGTWITEALSDGRLLDVREARLQAVPDSLTRTIRGEAPVASAAPAPAADATATAAPPAPGALELAGAAPLDAVVDLVVQWYALQPGAAPAGEAR
ncbi:MAG TPA: hypothetical protein VNP72_09850 [Longimicrobium sp.]|nr:hypothetical protein [Longimicrobium sp.]